MAFFPVRHSIARRPHAPARTRTRCDHQSARPSQKDTTPQRPTRRVWYADESSVLHAARSPVAVLAQARREAPNAHAIAEGALFADLTVLIVLVGLYVPYASAAMAAISPVPLLLLTIRRGWRVSTEATIVACLLVGFLAGPF